jgi:hypothetical protein
VNTPGNLKPDPRWRNFATDYPALQASADEWPVGQAVPDGIAEVLRVSRELFVYSYFVYDFLLTAVIWGLLALEASLRVCLEVGDDESLKRLIQRAHANGLITEAEADVLDATRKLRNSIVHGRLLPAFTPGAAEGMLRGTHEAIADLHARAQTKVQ